MRLDRTSRFPGDDRGVDAHCLGLLASGAILIGAYVKGVMRASAEIVPDRTARRAEAAITIEDGFYDRGFERELTAKILDEARRCHISDVRVHELLDQPQLQDAGLRGAHLLRLINLGMILSENRFTLFGIMP